MHLSRKEPEFYVPIHSSATFFTPHHRTLQRFLFGPRQPLAHLRRAAFLEGMGAATPALIATSAWALVTGVAMVRAGLTEGQALGMTLLVYAGSAQLAALPLIAAHAPLWVIVLTALVLNLRFVIFSAALHPYLRRLPLRQRWLMGYLTTDFGSAICLTHWERWKQEGDAELGSTRQLWFFAGLASISWFTWQSSSIIGILAGAAVPVQWGLDFLPIIALIALMVPMVMNQPALMGVGVACVVALISNDLPLRLGLLASVLGGVGAAMLTEWLQEKRQKKTEAPS